MPLTRVQRVWLSQARRLTAGMVFVAYLATALGIPIPQGVAKEAVQQPQTPRSCCGTGKCCCSKDATESKSCCSPSTAKHTQPDDRWHLRLSAPQCRCLATLWVSTGSVLPTLLAPAWTPGLVPLDWVADYETAVLVRSSIPPDPPPRLLA